MKYTKELILGVCIFILSLGGIAYANTDTPLNQEDVWVAVSLFDGITPGKAVEYYGSIDKSTFDGIVNNTIKDGLFKLNYTSWMDESGIVLMNNNKMSGRSRGYSFETYMLVRTITRIVILDKKFVNNTLLPEFTETEEKNL